MIRLIGEEKSKGSGDDVGGAPYLLVSGDASVHGRVYDSVQTHAERVDVAVMLPVLVLADQGAQLLGLVLHDVDGVLQGADLHLGRGQEGKPSILNSRSSEKETVCVSFYPPWGAKKKKEKKALGWNQWKVPL